MKKRNSLKRIQSKLKRGDRVVVISGGNKKKRPTKGQVGTIARFMGEKVIVQGVNLLTKHKRANQPGEKSQVLKIEGPIHISNVMYYVEKLGKGVRLRTKVLEDGSKVRGYLDSKTKEFVQLEK